MINPAPGAPEEIAAFKTLQDKLADVYGQVANDPRAEHTVLVVPSLSLDARELSKISGVHHYEERLLFMLMLLRRPRISQANQFNQPWRNLRGISKKEVALARL